MDCTRTHRVCWEANEILLLLALSLLFLLLSWLVSLVNFHHIHEDILKWAISYSNIDNLQLLLWFLECLEDGWHFVLWWDFEYQVSIVLFMQLWPWEVLLEEAKYLLHSLRIFLLFLILLCLNKAVYGSSEVHLLVLHIIIADLIAFLNLIDGVSVEQLSFLSGDADWGSVPLSILFFESDLRGYRPQHSLCYYANSIAKCISLLHHVSS